MKKHLRYLSYLLRHKWYVFVECCKLGIPWRGLVHDWHKFLPCEWFPYVNQFYEEKPPSKKVSENFSLAWLKHQKRGKHHWQYWILFKDNGDMELFSMPDQYRKEMLADWRGAGKAINGKDDTPQWYARNREDMILHPLTRAWVEEQIGKQIGL